MDMIRSSGMWSICGYLPRQLNYSKIIFLIELKIQEYYELISGQHIDWWGVGRPTKNSCKYTSKFEEKKIKALIGLFLDPSIPNSCLLHKHF